MDSDINNQFCLAVDTSGRVGSVCIGKGQEILQEKSFSGMMRHAAELFPTIVEIMKPYNIEASQIRNVFVTAGPGSFTGLRIGITLAKMMALAGDVRIVSASTLDVLAQNAINKIKSENLDINRVAPVIDAKRKQFFVNLFQKTTENDRKWQKTTNDCMMNVETFLSQFDKGGDDPVWLLGEGLKYYQGQFESEGVKFFDESLWGAKASNLYKLCYEKALNDQFEDPAAFVPHYLRLSDAEEAWQVKFATPEK